MAKTIRIRWTTRGTVFLDAQAYRRDVGDEDILPVGYARTLIQGEQAKAVKEQEKEEILLAEICDESDDLIFS